MRMNKTPRMLNPQRIPYSLGRNCQNQSKEPASPRGVAKRTASLTGADVLRVSLPKMKQVQKLNPPCAKLKQTAEMVHFYMEGTDDFPFSDGMERRQNCKEIVVWARLKFATENFLQDVQKWVNCRQNGKKVSLAVPDSPCNLNLVSGKQLHVGGDSLVDPVALDTGNARECDEGVFFDEPGAEAPASHCKRSRKSFFGPDNKENSSDEESDSSEFVIGGPVEEKLPPGYARFASNGGSVEDQEICPHDWPRELCTVCLRSEMCEHGRIGKRCRQCAGIGSSHPSTGSRKRSKPSFFGERGE
mmetsp:Transcript_25428/g.51713  ORF Transcript_25428/g.51713 Transcript_25428/m.51713 type:complete len:302 (-) Transcript_25428:1015-1920(-)